MRVSLIVWVHEHDSEADGDCESKPGRDCMSVTVSLIMIVSLSKFDSDCMIMKVCLIVSVHKYESECA